MKRLLQASLALQVLLALLAGAIAGVLLGADAVLFKPLGSMFLNAIKLLVAPLIFLALVAGMLALAGEQRMGRLAGKSIALFLLTALIASVLGLAVGSAFPFAANPDLLQTEVKARDIPPVSQVLVNLIPTSFLQPFVEGNVLQLILLAVLSGLALNQAGPEAEPLRQWVKAGNSLMFSLTQLVLRFTPIGVFGLIASTTGQYGLAVLLPLGWFIAAIYTGCILHMLLTYGALVRLGSQMPLRQYFRAILPAQLVAFSTGSSYGTLPVTYKVVTEQLKVSRSYASFVLPLGSTINMDGCGGIYPAIAAIFIATLYGVPLEFTDYLLIVATATLASLGTAGVPGTAMVMLTVTLNAVGLPLEGIAFVAAIDRIVDMIRTTTNVSGDMAVALVVASQEGLLQGEQPVDAVADTAADQSFAASLAQGQDVCAIPTTTATLLPATDKSQAA